MRRLLPWGHRREPPAQLTVPNIATDEPAKVWRPEPAGLSFSKAAGGGSNPLPGTLKPGRSEAERASPVSFEDDSDDFEYSLAVEPRKPLPLAPPQLKRQPARFERPEPAAATFADRAAGFGGAAGPAAALDEPLDQGDEEEDAGEDESWDEEEAAVVQQRLLAFLVNGPPSPEQWRLGGDHGGHSSDGFISALGVKPKVPKPAPATSGAHVPFKAAASPPLARSVHAGAGRSWSLDAVLARDDGLAAMRAFISARGRGEIGEIGSPVSDDSPFDEAAAHEALEGWLRARQLHDNAQRAKTYEVLRRDVWPRFELSRYGMYLEAIWLAAAVDEHAKSWPARRKLRALLMSGLLAAAAGGGNGTDGGADTHVSSAEKREALHLAIAIVSSAAPLLDSARDDASRSAFLKFKSAGRLARVAKQASAAAAGAVTGARTASEAGGALDRRQRRQQLREETRAALHAEWELRHGPLSSQPLSSRRFRHVRGVRHSSQPLSSSAHGVAHDQLLSDVARQARVAATAARLSDWHAKDASGHVRHLKKMWESASELPVRRQQGVVCELVALRAAAEEMLEDEVSRSQVRRSQVRRSQVSRSRDVDEYWQVRALIGQRGEGNVTAGAQGADGGDEGRSRSSAALHLLRPKLREMVQFWKHSPYWHGASNSDAHPEYEQRRKAYHDILAAARERREQTLAQLALERRVRLSQIHADALRFHKLGLRRTDMSSATAMEHHQYKQGMPSKYGMTSKYGMPSWRDGGGPDTCRGTKDRPPRKLKRSPPKKARQRIGQVEVPPQIPNMGGPCPNMGGCGEYKALSAAELATRATKAARAAARTQAQAAREGARAALESDAARRIQQQALARQRRGRGAADEAVPVGTRELWNRELPCAQYGNDALVAIVQIWVDSTAWLAETWSHVEAETHIWKVRVHERLSLLQPAPAAAKPLRALHASAQYGATAKLIRALPSPDPDNLLERERRKWAEASNGMVYFDGREWKLNTIDSMGGVPNMGLGRPSVDFGGLTSCRPPPLHVPSVDAEEEPFVPEEEDEGAEAYAGDARLTQGDGLMMAKARRRSPDVPTASLWQHQSLEAEAVLPAKDKVSARLKAVEAVDHAEYRYEGEAVLRSANLLPASTAEQRIARAADLEAEMNWLPNMGSLELEAEIHRVEAALAAAQHGARRQSLEAEMHWLPNMGCQSLEAEMHWLPNKGCQSLEAEMVHAVQEADERIRLIEEQCRRKLEAMMRQQHVIDTMQRHVWRTHIRQPADATKVLEVFVRRWRARRARTGTIQGRAPDSKVEPPVLKGHLDGFLAQIHALATAVSSFLAHAQATVPAVGGLLAQLHAGTEPRAGTIDTKSTMPSALPRACNEGGYQHAMRALPRAVVGTRVSASSLSSPPPPEDRSNLLERERRRWAAVALKAQGGLRLDLEGLNAFEAMTATMKELGCESGED